MKLVLALCRCTVLAIPQISASAQTSQVSEREGDVPQCSLPAAKIVFSEFNIIAAANITEHVAMQASNVAPT